MGRIHEQSRIAKSFASQSSDLTSGEKWLRADKVLSDARLMADESAADRFLGTCELPNDLHGFRRVSFGDI